MGLEETRKMEDAEKDGSVYGFRPKLVWNAGVQEYLTQAYGPTQFHAISEALTRPCINSTVRVNTLQASTQEVMEQLRYIIGGKSSDDVSNCVSSEFEDLHATEGQNIQFSRSRKEELSEVCREDVNEDSSSRGTLIDGLELRIHTRERALVTEVEGNGAVEDSICWEHPSLKDVVMVRGRGPCEVSCKDESGVPLKEVVVSRKCAEAVLRGANVFVPGVLACSLRVEKGDIVAVTVAVERSDADGGWSVGITRGTTLESEHANAQLEGSCRSSFFIGKGRMAMSRTTVFRESKGVAVEMRNRIFDLPPFHGLLPGQIFLQNLPSVVAARVLDPKPGERILDMCAAPGGKTTAIGILMQNKGEIIALDRSHNKVLDIKRLSEEMKLTCIQAYKLDATKAVNCKQCVAETLVSPFQGLRSTENADANTTPKGNSLSEEPQVGLQSSTQPGDDCLVNQDLSASKAAARKEARKLKNRLASEAAALQRVKGFEPHSFDRVLLDAPCSALGLRPRLFAGEETQESLRGHSCYQRKLFDQAVQLVRPGGILVYSTCTINPGENEAVVRYALDTYDFLSLAPQEPRIGGPGLVGGLNVFDGMSYKEWLKEDEKHLVQRFNPCECYDTIGFFIAKFVIASKRGECEVSLPTV